MWKLSIEDDQGATTVVQLVRIEYTLGRGEENTIRLTERNISRRHARLTKQGAIWFLVDCGSYNGCFVNGVRAGDSHPVGPRDLIQLGDYRLEFITDESTQVDADTRNDTLNSNVPVPMVASNNDRLVMVVGPTPGREYILNQDRQTLGRGDNCSITVNHASVSRVHAEIHPLKDSCYEIIDKKSSNGLRINGVELKQGIIEARDVVEFGDVVLKFIPAGQVYRPTPEETKKLAALLGVGDGEGVFDHSTRFKLAWSSMSRPVRWGVSVLGVLVLVMFGAVIATGRSNRGGGTLHSGSPSLDANAQALQDARELAAVGKFEEAHSRLAKISVRSPQRKEAAFALVEGKWADALFERAARATTNEEKRAILDTLVNEPNLDRFRADKAKEQLANLRDDNVVAVDELPKTQPVKSASLPVVTAPVEVAKAEPVTPSVTRASTAAAMGIASSTRAVQTRPTAAAAPQTKPAAAAVAPQTKPAAAAAAPQVALESAVSPELVQARAKKNALRARVAAGTATEQEKRLLRSLCRQLNDASCSH